ncbi:MAG: hypothetical protein ABL929_03765 [Ferruginibacter sp.]|nr:hypothetical protein [Ferruginibacter sp.]
MEVLERPVQKSNTSKMGDIVIKQYGDKTVVSKYPDMSNIVPSQSQVQKRSRFAQAVAYAKTINNSPIFRADFLKRKGKVKSVYQSALKEFLDREF